MTVRAEVSKHERDGWPFDTSGPTEFCMQMAEKMIMACNCTMPRRIRFGKRLPRALEPTKHQQKIDGL